MSTAKQFETDIIPTTAGELAITFLGHGSLQFTINGKVIYVDPFSRVADYSQLPPADAIFITHEHGDHFDPQAIARVRLEKTQVVLAEACLPQPPRSIVMRNGDKRIVGGVKVEAVPAYNLIHKRENGEPFHPKGSGNGYVLTFGETRVYVAGDTENIPEMMDLHNIDCAFLPVNLPYTMSLEMAADAAKTIQPRILYPYHFGDTEISKLKMLLKNEKKIETRIRRMG